MSDALTTRISDYIDLTTVQGTRVSIHKDSIVAICELKGRGCRIVTAYMDVNTYDDYEKVVEMADRGDLFGFRKNRFKKEQTDVG